MPSVLPLQFPDRLNERFRRGNPVVAQLLHLMEQGLEDMGRVRQFHRRYQLLRPLSVHDIKDFGHALQKHPLSAPLMKQLVEKCPKTTVVDRKVLRQLVQRWFGMFRFSFEGEPQAQVDALDILLELERLGVPIPNAVEECCFGMVKAAVTRNFSDFPQRFPQVVEPLLRSVEKYTLTNAALPSSTNTVAGFVFSQSVPFLVARVLDSCACEFTPAQLERAYVVHEHLQKEKSLSSPSAFLQQWERHQLSKAVENIFGDKTPPRKI